MASSLGSKSRIVYLMLFTSGIHTVNQKRRGGPAGWPSRLRSVPLRTRLEQRLPALSTLLGCRADVERPTRSEGRQWGRAAPGQVLVHWRRVRESRPLRLGECATQRFTVLLFAFSTSCFCRSFVARALAFRYPCSATEKLFDRQWPLHLVRETQR